MAFEGTAQPADREKVLLYKWAAARFAQSGVGDAPQPSDSRRLLLYKIALNT